MDDLAMVICTHGHPDHAGGARELARSGVEIRMHPADADSLRIGWRAALRQPSRGRIFAAMTPEPPVIVPIEDGDVLAGPGRTRGGPYTWPHAGQRLPVRGP